MLDRTGKETTDPELSHPTIGDGICPTHRSRSFLLSLSGTITVCLSSPIQPLLHTAHLIFTSVTAKSRRCAPYTLPLIYLLLESLRELLPNIFRCSKKAVKRKAEGWRTSLTVIKSFCLFYFTLKTVIKQMEGKRSIQITKDRAEGTELNEDKSVCLFCWN